MSLIQQLQKTPKWKEFEEWYNKQDYSIPMEGYLERDYIVGFDDLDFEFTKGVFEKFIESQEAVFEQTCSADYSNKPYSIWTAYSIWTVETGYKKSKSFEELLIWYFNN